MQVEKEILKAIQHMEEVEVEVKKKKEISSRVKQLRKQVHLPKQHMLALPHVVYGFLCCVMKQCSHHV